MSLLATLNCEVRERECTTQLGSVSCPFDRHAACGIICSAWVRAVSAHIKCNRKSWPAVKRRVGAQPEGSRITTRSFRGFLRTIEIIACAEWARRANPPDVDATSMALRRVVCTTPGQISSHSPASAPRAVLRAHEGAYCGRRSEAF